MHATGNVSRPALSFWQIWNMSFGFLGIQFGFALQGGFMSRIFQTLGAEKDALPLLWIAAPLTGLLVQPVIGWFSDLDAMTLDDLQRHYDTYYSPNNATLVVVGDIKADSLLPTIKQLFEPIPRGPEPKLIATMESEQKGERRFLLKRDAQVPFVMMGYRVPNFTSEDSYALDIRMGRVHVSTRTSCTSRDRRLQSEQNTAYCRLILAFSTSMLS